MCRSLFQYLLRRGRNDLFSSLYQETVSSLRSDSYIVQYENFQKSVENLLDPEKPVLSSGHQHFTYKAQLLQDLEERSQNIVNTLIERDDLTELERAKLRGEKEGLSFAIKQIKRVNLGHKYE